MAVDPSVISINFPPDGYTGHTILTEDAHKQSDLCVTGETEILTDQGFLPISVCATSDFITTVWNGYEWSDVTVYKTSEDAELVRVWFEDGGYIDCTPQHSFYLTDDAETAVMAGLLHRGDVLEGSLRQEPLEDTEATDPRTRNLAYTAGWLTFAGFEDSNRVATFVGSLTPLEATRRLTAVSVDSEADEDGMMIRFESRTIPGALVPLTWMTTRKTLWLGGALDAAGGWMEFEGESYLTIGSTDVDTIREMRLLALECGLAPRVRLTDTMNAFSLHQHEVWLLAQAGAYTGVVEDCASLSSVPIVSDVHPLPYTLPTYCATEPKRGRLVFNGYLTGNCVRQY